MQLAGYRLSEVLLRGDFNVALLRFALQHMSPGASPTTMPSFFGLWRKAVFYQRTTGSSSAKESQEAPRGSQCVHEYSRENANAIAQFRPRTNHLHREYRLFNQMLGSSSRINRGSLQPLGNAKHTSLVARVSSDLPFDIRVWTKDHC